MKKDYFTKLKAGFRVMVVIVCTLGALLPAYAQHASKKTVSGTVLDEAGTPLVGVSIYAKDTPVATSSDVKGRFALEVDRNSTIVFSYIGMKTQEIPAEQVTNLTVEMENDATEIDDVLVVGYGTQRKVDLTGAVASLDAESATKNRVVMDLSSVLLGKVSGVRVTSSEGTPGSQAKITIRGTTSINSDSNPLYVVDGVISENMNVSPGDIESISVLKDAASTAIYGSRGANGVILISTKKGDKNRTTVDIYAMAGVQRIARDIPMMNSRENVEKNYMRSFIYRTAAEGVGDINTVDPRGYEVFQDPEGNFYYVSKTAAYSGEFYRTRPLYYNTNWQKEMTQAAPLYDFRVSVNGSTKTNRYAIMVNAQNQDGIMINTGWDSKSARVNFSQDIAKWLDVGVYLSYTRSNAFGNAGNRQDGIIYNTLTQSPLYPSDFGMDFKTPDGIPILNLSNPVSLAKLNTRDKRNSSLSGTASINIKPLEGLTINLNQTYYTNDEEIHLYYPSTVAEGNSANGRARFERGWSEGWSSENTATYTREINTIHRITGMVGMSARSTRWENFNVEGNQFEQEDLGYYGFPSAKTMLPPGLSDTKVNEVSFFGRLNYSLMDKYIFQATVRADGSSRFAENNKWGYFPSASAAWRISEEGWMKNVRFINNLKLRASWGISGKQAIGAYESLAKVGTYVTTINGLDPVMASYFSSLENSNLKWETTTEYNVGLDVDFWDSRLGVVIDAYNKTTSNLLYANPVPQYTGYGTVTENMGKIRNRGIEFTVKAVPVQSRNFEWALDFNIGLNRSKVLALGIQDWQTVGTGWRTGEQGYLEVGKPLGNWYGLKVLGIWQSQSQIDQAVAQGLIDESQKPIPGQYRFYDRDGNGKTTAEDRVIIGSAEPDFTGGLSTSFTYRNLTLSANFVFTYGNQIFNGNSYEMSGSNNYNNAYKSAVNRWKPTLYYYDAVNGVRGELFMEGNPSNKIPVSSSGLTPIEMANDTWIEDGSYLRMQDITLSYTLPEKFVRKLRLSNVRIFLTGTNVFCWTNYSGFDPDVNVSSGQASYLQPGLDYFSYPRARSFSGGINITF